MSGVEGYIKMCLNQISSMWCTAYQFCLIVVRSQLFLHKTLSHQQFSQPFHFMYKMCLLGLLLNLLESVRDLPDELK